MRAGRGPGWLSGWGIVLLDRSFAVLEPAAASGSTQVAVGVDIWSFGGSVWRVCMRDCAGVSRGFFVCCCSPGLPPPRHPGGAMLASCVLGGTHSHPSAWLIPANAPRKRECAVLGLGRSHKGRVPSVVALDPFRQAPVRGHSPAQHDPDAYACDEACASRQREADHRSDSALSPRPSRG